MNSAHSYSEGAEVPEDKTPTDNELIAEFMGGKWETVWCAGVETKAFNFPGWNITDWPHIIREDTFKYATSWDWLVPVALRFTEKAKHADMPHAIFMNVYTFSVCGPIEELYKNIITGIKWYNQQKLKTRT